MKKIEIVKQIIYETTKVSIQKLVRGCKTTTGFIGK